MSDQEKLTKSIEKASTILVVQAENPDGDSLASSLALEGLLSKMGKDVVMHCAVNMPDHLKHLAGWDRVEGLVDVPFDLAIIVDTSRDSLLRKTIKQLGRRLTSIDVFVLDHHKTKADLSFDAVYIVDTDVASTGELIYKIATDSKWEIDQPTADMLATSIMYDSLGLMTPTTSAATIRIVADLVESGVSLAKLEEKRKESMKRDPDITNYKGELIQRIEYLLEGRVAYVHIPWEEIEKYSPRYNPSMLVLDEMRFTKGVMVAIAFKTYPDGRLTAKIKANYGYPLARGLAESFGGGGHEYAAGFKLEPGNLKVTLAGVVDFLNNKLDDEVI